MVTIARFPRIKPFLICCCVALALVGTAQAQIISEIEVPQARDKPASKPKKPSRPATPQGVTPSEVLSAPVEALPEARPQTLPGSATKKVRPRSAKVPAEVPTSGTQTAAAEDLGFPSIDANRWCARISGRVATANCVQFEEKQRDFARIFWDDLSEDGKRYCAGTVVQLGVEAATNQSLAACVRTRLAQEEGKQDTSSAPVFRR